MLTIAVDVDGVIADSYPPWLERYHRDNPTGVKIALAEVYDQKAKDSKELLSYLNDPHFYDEVPEVAGAFNGVTALRAWGHRVVFVTSCPQGQTDAKWQWLQANGFLPKGKMQEKDLVVCHDKPLLAPSFHLIVEDTLKSVKGWHRAILLDKPYNQDGGGKYTRVSTWQEVVDAVICMDAEINKPQCICTGFMSDPDCEVCSERD